MADPSPPPDRTSQATSPHAGEALVEIIRREEFSAAHRLFSPELSDEENRRIYGPCFTDHGHNYVLEVSVLGPVDPRTGMVVNLFDLMRILRERVIDLVEHKHLNRDVDFLAGIIPTAENIAIAVWDRIEPDLQAFPQCRLHRIRLYETRDNFVDYRGRQTSTRAT